MNPPHPPSSIASHDVAQAQFARRVVARLDEGIERLDGDIATRLRFAREFAVAHARQVQATASATTAVGLTRSGATLLGGGSSWWVRVASIAPILALAGGLILIQQWQTRAQIAVAAEVDVALLADDLPLNAYRDAGFVEFLKTAPHE